MKVPKTPILTQSQKAQILGDNKPIVVFDIRKYPSPLYFPPPSMGVGHYDRMTILVGIICKEFIVLGADSQWTNSTDGSTVKADKIAIVDFGDNQVIVGQAGLRPITMEIVETMRKKARGINITEPLDVTRIVKDAIRETKKSLDRDAKVFGKTYGAALMIAFYAQNQPHLYTCHVFGTGVPEPAEAHYATAGCADMLANYFLAEFSAPRAIDEIQLAALIYTLMKVKENNAYCGGLTTIKFLMPFWTGKDSLPIVKAFSAPAPFIAKLEELLKIRDQKTKGVRNAEILAILREASEQIAKEQNWKSPTP